jgi:hypothetical protein
VQKELNQSNHKNFWDLSANQCLPTETKNYVPQMIAATIIAKNPERFGFKNVPYMPPLAYDRVEVTEPTSIKAAAVAVNVPPEELQALNPELMRGVTPPDASYKLNLPTKSKELFGRNIVIARLEHPAVASRGIRTVRAGSRSYQGQGQPEAGRQVAAAAKADKNGKKSKTAAKTAKIQTTEVAYTKNGKPAKNATNGGVSPQVASILGHPNPAVKNGHPSDSKSKSKSAVSKSAGKKGKGTHVAKKGDNSSRTRHSNKRGRSKEAKEKAAKSKSKPLLVSEVR